MTPPISMHETAFAVGLSYDRFRKIWRDLCATEAFPAPVLGCRWDPDVVAAWKRARSGRRPSAAAPPIAAPAELRQPRPTGRLADLRRAG